MDAALVTSLQKVDRAATNIQDSCTLFGRNSPEYKDAIKQYNRAVMNYYDLNASLARLESSRLHSSSCTSLDSCE
jgi:hypothetical protein